mmetsp:Transcript_17755/g.30066  ORF Transcript_17755/g.30066 Transcript_17755/m.30066 type:complete len:113 (-) Transcript_17755:730-1068(-)
MVKDLQGDHEQIAAKPKVSSLSKTIKKKPDSQKEKSCQKKEQKFFQTITLTFGECAENHYGMQQIGSIAKEGFSCKDLEEIKRSLEKEFSAQCEIVNIFDSLPKSYREMAGS